MPITIPTIDGFGAVVDDSGPSGSTVVILGAAKQLTAAYGAVCERLHTASLRTIVIAADPRMHPKSVVGIMDTLDVKWATLVGDRAGAELGWELAAHRLDRFTGLVVVDRGHPRVRDQNGFVRDADCPPVEVNTTVLASTPTARSIAKASERYVYADFRLVETVRPRNAQNSTAQLAAEVVMRTSTW